jgi:ornithine carbamoyltransferase
MPSEYIRSVLVNARMLQQVPQEGAQRSLLRGRNLALICASDGGEAQNLFRQAGTELGAQVAHVQFNLSGLGTLQELQHTARVLGRLYDALECQGLAPELVQQLGREAGVPVFDGLALPTHPTASLTAMLECNASESDKRRWILQAVLLGAMPVRL